MVSVASGSSCNNLSKEDGQFNILWKGAMDSLLSQFETVEVPKV